VHAAFHDLAATKADELPKMRFLEQMKKNGCAILWTASII
jgi:hypothetical protein